MRIKHLPADSAFGRAVLGGAATVTMDTHLLAHISYLLAGGNWQRSGGRGRRPKPIELPGAASRQAAPASAVPDAVRRLRNLGLIPAE